MKTANSIQSGSFPSTGGVTVGFEMTTYLVGEDDVNGQGETVEVCAVITEGLLQGRAVTLVFVTGTGTATSE